MFVALSAGRQLLISRPRRTASRAQQERDRTSARAKSVETLKNAACDAIQTTCSRNPYTQLRAVHEYISRAPYRAGPAEVGVFSPWRLGVAYVLLTRRTVISRYREAALRRPSTTVPERRLRTPVGCHPSERLAGYKIGIQSDPSCLGPRLFELPQMCRRGSQPDPAWW